MAGRSTVDGTGASCPESPRWTGRVHRPPSPPPVFVKGVVNDEAHIRRIQRGKRPPAPALRPAGPWQPGRRELRTVRDPGPRPGRPRGVHRVLDAPRQRDPEGGGGPVLARSVVRVPQLRLPDGDGQRGRDLRRSPRPARPEPGRDSPPEDLRTAAGDELPHELRRPWGWQSLLA